MNNLELCTKLILEKLYGKPFEEAVIDEKNIWIDSQFRCIQENLDPINYQCFPITLSRVLQALCNEYKCSVVQLIAQNLLRTEQFSMNILYVIEHWQLLDSNNQDCTLENQSPEVWEKLIELLK